MLINSNTSLNIYPQKEKPPIMTALNPEEMRPIIEYYFSRFILKKFDAIKSNIPKTTNGIDNEPNESGVPETPIVLLNANPMTATQIPMNAIIFPFRLNLFKNICTPLFFRKKLFN